MGITQTIAQKVRQQIVDEYTYDNRFHVNTMDLINHLISGNIDHGTPSMYTINGHHVSDDKSLFVTTFSDSSCLIVGTSVGVEAT